MLKLLNVINHSTVLGKLLNAVILTEEHMQMFSAPCSVVFLSYFITVSEIYTCVQFVAVLN
jgi:hypothetical protein